MIVVSHDRDFLDGLVDKLYEFRDGKVREHLGSVSDFLARRKLETLQELERSASAERPQPVKDDSAYKELKEKSKLDRKKKNRISYLECEIEKLESRMAGIETVLSAPGPDDDIMELTREYLECKRDLDAKTEEWGTLIE